MDTESETPASIDVARIQTPKEGPIEFAATTPHTSQHALAEWCREHWQDHRRHIPGLPAEPPAQDARVVEEYFHDPDGTYLETALVELEPLAYTTPLSEAELDAAYQRLDALAHEVLAQRATIGRAILHRIEARQTPGSEQPLSPDDERRVKRLLTGILFEEAARYARNRDALDQARADVSPGEDENAGLPEKTDEEIMERIVGELPRRQFERLVRWSREQLERIVALNEQSLARRHS